MNYIALDSEKYLDQSMKREIRSYKSDLNREAIGNLAKFLIALGLIWAVTSSVDYFPAFFAWSDQIIDQGMPAIRRFFR